MADPKCRHCGKPLIVTGNGVWTDSNGFPGCIKGGLWRDPLTNEVKSRPVVAHEPMPVVRAGADQTSEEK